MKALPEVLAESFSRLELGVETRVKSGEKRRLRIVKGTPEITLRPDDFLSFAATKRAIQGLLAQAERAKESPLPDIGDVSPPRPIHHKLNKEILGRGVVKLIDSIGLEKLAERKSAISSGEATKDGWINYAELKGLTRKEALEFWHFSIGA